MPTLADHAINICLFVPFAGKEEVLCCRAPLQVRPGLAQPGTAEVDDDLDACRAEKPGHLPARAAICTRTDACALVPAHRPCLKLYDFPGQSACRPDCQESQ